MGTQVSHPVSWQVSAVCEGAHDVSSILPCSFAASSLSEEMLTTVFVRGLQQRVAQRQLADNLKCMEPSLVSLDSSPLWPCGCCRSEIPWGG